MIGKVILLSHVTQKWEIRAKLRNVDICLGRFNTREEAINAIDHHAGTRSKFDQYDLVQVFVNNKQKPMKTIRTQCTKG